jgi:hypothetical protein
MNAKNEQGRIVHTVHYKRKEALQVQAEAHHAWLFMGSSPHLAAASWCGCSAS